jgi:cation diffusion facilitator CzcD-associated flavoprotein CzcO
VDGHDIWQYLADTARESGLDKHIDFGTKVSTANWSSADAQWRVSAEAGGAPVTYVARFVVFCTGYYDYEQPYDPEFAGVADFQGSLVHPQFWPENLDYAGERVVVIGSGATAVTVVPAMARTAAHVTMLQRRPTYLLARPRGDKVADLLRRVLPPRTAHRIVRDKNTVLQWALYRACRRWPDRMRALLLKGAAAGLGGDTRLVEEQFSPPYAPWDERLCVVPDGDLFAAVRDGSASVVTGHIERFVPTGVRLTTGEVIEADIVVTATGLMVQLVGGIGVTVDGARVDPAACLSYYGAMLSGVPNLAFCIGYINASWTMRADLTARFVARVVERLVATGCDIVTPVAPTAPGPTTPFMDMQSGYLRRAAPLMPRVTTRYPWAARQNVLTDAWATNHADLDRGLAWHRPRRDAAE